LLLLTVAISMLGAVPALGPAAEPGDPTVSRLERAAQVRFHQRRHLAGRPANVLALGALLST
jgi:hypothetical protein